ncbi:hypothetical protein ACIFOT_20585 [Neobacillus sp. NRS-1170]|uniref:hypothetical protein n=1 Tax=Neobacillus sp. NRS-1170 TaxID=3233898 RepID=UPI003D2E783A
MKFIVKAFDRNRQEIGFQNTIFGEKEVTFEDEKAAEAFIVGIKNSLPPDFNYKIIPKEAPKDDLWSNTDKFW